MDRGVKACGVKRIRIHDLRHSHVSLLINMGFSVLAIGNRFGHESEKITYRYAHLFPSVQDDMAKLWTKKGKEIKNDYIWTHCCFSCIDYKLYRSLNINVPA